MNPATEQIHLEFDLSDKDIAEFIYNSKPPDGVMISKPASLLKRPLIQAAFSLKLQFSLPMMFMI
jgi:hypothetical protein